MKIKISPRVVAIIMLFLGIAFDVYAMFHPEGSFPWNNNIVHSIYFVYILILTVLFFLPNIRKKINKDKKNRR